MNYGEWFVKTLDHQDKYHWRLCQGDQPVMVSTGFTTIIMVKYKSSLLVQSITASIVHFVIKVPKLVQMIVTIL